jgi:hypothetical protein
MPLLEFTELWTELKPERNHVQIKSDAFGNQFAGCPIKSWELKIPRDNNTHTMTCCA